MLVKVVGKDTETVINALIKNARKLPQELFKTLNWDRGKELADHRRFTLATDVTVYFCAPRSPWQRGSNENTNGLLRQYFPKGINIAVYSRAKLNAVARQLNNRPRKTLDYETPAERFNQTVASTSWTRRRKRTRSASRYRRVLPRSYATDHPGDHGSVGLLDRTDTDKLVSFAWKRLRNQE